MQKQNSMPLWGFAYCGFAVFAITAFMGIAGYIDPAVLAMP